MLKEVLVIVAAYLLGSISTAVWYGQLFHDIDIRKAGSGNAGATNSLRVLGKKAGIVVLVIDLLKGFLAVQLAILIFPDKQIISLLAGFAAVLGHLLPIFAGFKGGKGVATSLGSILAIYPLGTLFCVIAFALVTFLSKYVSLASLLGAAVFVATVAIFQLHNTPLLIFGISLFLLLVFTHRTNVKRLLNGVEPKLGQKNN